MQVERVEVNEIPGDKKSWVAAAGYAVIEPRRSFTVSLRFEGDELVSLADEAALDKLAGLMDWKGPFGALDKFADSSAHCYFVVDALTQERFPAATKPERAANLVLATAMHALNELQKGRQAASLP